LENKKSREGINEISLRISFATMNINLEIYQLAKVLK